MPQDYLACHQSTWSCCCPSPPVPPAAMEPWPVHYFVPDLLFLTLSLPRLLSRPLECSAMKSQLTFTPEILTCCTLYNFCHYYLILLVIYERLNILKNNLVLMAMYSYNLHLAQPEEDWPPFRALFLSRVFPSHCASTSAFLAVWGFSLGFCIALCDICWCIKGFINTFDWLIDWLFRYCDPQ